MCVADIVVDKLVIIISMDDGEMLVDFLEAWALIIATIETTVGFLVVAKVDGDVCVDKVAEEEHEMGDGV